MQPLGDLLVRRRGRRRRERHARHPGEPLAQVAESQVVGTEVVTPLRHAVGLVDRDDAERSTLQQRGGLCVREALGGDVDEVELAGDVGPLDLATLVDRLGGVEVGRLHTVGPQGIDLVVHERDERADHEARALTDEGGHLVGDALSATGRHQHDGVSAGDDLLDDVGLVATELVVAEDGVQSLARGRVPARRRATSGRSRGCGGHRRDRTLTPVERRLVARPLRLPVHRLGRGGRLPAVVVGLVGVRQVRVRVTGSLRHPSSVTTPADAGGASSTPSTARLPKPRPPASPTECRTPTRRCGSRRSGFPPGPTAHAGRRLEASVRRSLR